MRGPRSRCGRPSRSRSIGLVLALRLVRGDAHDRRTLDVDDVVHLEVELPGSPRGDELHREVRLFEQVRVMGLADPFERHLEDLEAPHCERIERLIPVDATSTVHFPHAATPPPFQPAPPPPPPAPPDPPARARTPPH